MTPAAKSQIGAVDAGALETRFCPECGQSLNVVRAEPDPRTIASWRWPFLVAVGLFLAVTSGVGALHAKEDSRYVTICRGSATQTDCVAAATPLAQQFAEQYLTGGGLAARIVDRDVASDLRYLGVGLIGVCVGLGAALVRWRRSRHVGFAGELILAVEGLLTVFYGQVLLLGLFLLVNSPAGSVLSLSRPEDSPFRALSMIFALVGVQ